MNANSKKMLLPNFWKSEFVGYLTLNPYIYINIYIYIYKNNLV